jgi:hypothetical protein
MARLIVNPGSPQAREMILKPGINRLGRNDTNDLVISEPSVSGSHCQLIVADKTVRVQDVGSTNGTFVNGVQVTDVSLSGNVQIRFGTVEVMFEADGSEEDAAPAPPALQTPASSPSHAPGGANPRPGPLRVSLGAIKEPAPVVAEVESSEVSAPPATALPPGTPCKFHRGTVARWVCTGCQKPYCDLCVSTRTTASGSEMFCRSCGGVAARVQVTIEMPEQRSFFKELPRAFAYPFRGRGVMILIVATIVIAALDFFRRMLGFVGFFVGWSVGVVVIGYLFAYAQNIINCSAVGEDRLPDLPALDEILGGFFSLVGVVLISFGPAIVVAYLAIAHEMPSAGIALIPAIVFGCLYFPMAFLAVAIKDTVMASNPLVVVPSILRVPLEYIITVLLIGGVFAIRWTGDAVSGMMGGEAFRTTSIGYMLLLFGLRAFWAFISVYLLTVTMRVLGVLYLTKSDRIGW